MAMPSTSSGLDYGNFKAGSGSRQSGSESEDDVPVQSIGRLAQGPRGRKRPRYEQRRLKPAKPLFKGRRS
jgi:hypothetical protein